MTRATSAPSREDIIEWADGTWCYRYELSEYSFMSDDYRVIADGSDEWCRYAFM